MSQTASSGKKIIRTQMTFFSLQAYPEQFFQQADVYVMPDAALAERTTGGVCAVTASWDSQVGVLKLALKRGGEERDPFVYYFPYVSQQIAGAGGAAGIGYVDVPADAATGTMVVTSGLCGCAVRVFRNDQNTFRFYHDANGVSVPKLLSYFGSLAFDAPISASTELKTRFKEQQFSSPYDSGEEGLAAAVKRTRNGDASQFNYCMIFLKEKTMWKAFISCVLTNGRNEATETVPVSTGKYLGGFPVQAPVRPL